MCFKRRLEWGDGCGCLTVWGRLFQTVAAWYEKDLCWLWSQWVLIFFLVSLIKKKKCMQKTASENWFNSNKWWSLWRVYLSLLDRSHLEFVWYSSCRHFTYCLPVYQVCIWRYTSWSVWHHVAWVVRRWPSVADRVL